MTYRDEQEAARHRIAALEGELLRMEGELLRMTEERDAWRDAWERGPGSMAAGAVPTAPTGSAGAPPRAGGFIGLAGALVALLAARHTALSAVLHPGVRAAALVASGAFWALWWFVGPIVARRSQ